MEWLIVVLAWAAVRGLKGDKGLRHFFGVPLSLTPPVLLGLGSACQHAISVCLPLCTGAAPGMLTERQVCVIVEVAGRLRKTKSNASLLALEVFSLYGHILVNCSINNKTCIRHILVIGRNVLNDLFCGDKKSISKVSTFLRPHPFPPRPSLF